MNRTSPPAPVTERPVATPGTAVRSAASWKNRWRPSASRTASTSIWTGGVGRPRGDAGRGLPQDLAELALEVADPGLAGVLGDHRADRLVVDLDLVRAQAVSLPLSRPQVAARDRQLLLGRVAVEAHHLHPVQKRRRNRLGDVRGGDEQDTGQVELDVQVVVAEAVVLGRVEHLEQRRRGVAAPVGAHLVDLVEHDHRVHRPGVAKRPDQAARQSSDVGAAVAANLGLVADASQRHADELPSGRPGDRLADRGLAGAGRADQGQDRPRPTLIADLALGPQLAHRDVLGDPVLDVLEARVVCVQDLARVVRIEALSRALAPRNRQEPVEVGPDHRGLARLAHPLQSAELSLGLIAHLVRHPRFVDLAPIIVDDRSLVLAELLADRLELLSEEVLALLLLGAGLDVVADPSSDLKLGQALALAATARSRRSVTSSVSRISRFCSKLRSGE